MLVEITKETNKVEIDLLYATDQNFTKAPVYTRALCYLHQDAVVKLNKAIDLAHRIGYKIKIFDAFRPQAAQQKLWDHTPDPTFLANPQSGSHHTRGVAVDVTLIDLKTGQDLDMGTPFDDFTPRSFHGNLDISDAAIQNRAILLGIMSTAGFDFYFNEWWHYQLFAPREYPLITHGTETDLMMLP